MILAGDLGGTNTRLGLFRGTTPRPDAVVRHDYRTYEFSGLPAIVLRFLREAGVEPKSIDAVCVGVAGPVRQGTAQLTNVPWLVSAAELREQLGLPPVLLLNDVVAMAYAVPALRGDDLTWLQAGHADPMGNAALITIGTGFGTCLLHRAGGRFLPSPAEGGHADFSPTTDREIEVLRAFRARFGRVDVERVASGQGLANLSDFAHGGGCPLMEPGIDAKRVPAQVTANARAGRCPQCREAFDIFLRAVWSAGASFALDTLATGGLFFGGGIAPRIAEDMQDPALLEGFRNRPPMTDVLSAMPVAIIRDPDAGLLGAAIAAIGN
jgi:glucokinase